ncbi:MAG: ATP-dependent Lon protease [Hyperionvirus sp.]|uniref:ATP-dependent Lon protease n=1 Tax=Hyperionvirus sp. TaxID=2487770 RepID=A0A3G5AB00_9VIRU|nr:MAG: ATP-dependent Lon protease [Hyperionvirus sp.]
MGIKYFLKRNTLYIFKKLLAKHKIIALSNHTILKFLKKQLDIDLYISQRRSDFFSSNILMEDSTVRECKISFLQHEYNRYAKSLYDMGQHIEFLYRAGFMQIGDRLRLLNQLNHDIRYMNQEIYNTKLKELKVTTQSNSVIVDSANESVPYETDSEAVDDTEKVDKPKEKEKENKVSNLDKNIYDIIGSPLHYNTNIDALLDICRNGKIGHLSNIIFNDFDKVADQIIKVGKDSGFRSIYHGLDLLIGCSHKELIIGKTIEAEAAGVGDGSTAEYTEKLKEFREMLELINMIFVPTKYNYVENAKDFEISSAINDHPPNDLFMQSYATISIVFPNTGKKFIFDGFFSPDPIQSMIRTCQIYKPLLYKKKKIIQSYADDLRTVNTKFANLYIKNMSAGEILSYGQEQFGVKLKGDFERYTKLSKMTFRSLMEEFTKDRGEKSERLSEKGMLLEYKGIEKGDGQPPRDANLRNMFVIIRLLLFGPDDCINMAGLLFGLTKDKKVGSEVVADIIYNNLTLPLQTKLKKSSVNIKNELDKIKNLSDDDVDIPRQIAANGNIPMRIKKIILNKLNELKTQSSEQSKHRTYVDILSRFPWMDNDRTFLDLSKDNKRGCEFIDRVGKTLNEKVYGHTECKQAIVELICKWIMNPSSMGKALSLAGPPGVGKTLIAKGLGDALGIPFRCISLCGVEDGTYLSGHSFTYSNAQHGAIVREMCEAGKARSILFFDELDKSCKKHGVNEVQNIFIQLTDPNMNKSFSDKFFQETTFPLDKVIFIFTYNDRSLLDPVLLDRITEIEVKSYSIKDKMKITNEFLLKEILEGVNLEHGSLKILDEDVKYIIENYTYESGVRKLKQLLESLLLKLNVDRMFQRGLFSCECKKDIEPKECECDRCGNCEKCSKCKICNAKCLKNCRVEINKLNPVVITRAIIEKYLPRPKIHHDKIHRVDEVGIVNGLYATQSGNGGLVNIVVQKNMMAGGGKFELKLTGSQGKVMKESVEFAWTTVSNLIRPIVMEECVNNYKSGIHIHALDGATSKDGPSAGCAFGVALISLVLGKKIRRDIAMTGEIGKFGEAKMIGGLSSKLYGAKRAGVKIVFIPKENELDLKELQDLDPQLFDETFKVVLVEFIHDILAEVLIETTGEKIDIKQYLN